MPLPRRFALLALLCGAIGWVVSLDAAAQPKKGAVTIPPEPLALRPGDALSIRALVQRPPVVAGTVSWTIETRRHRGYISTSALSPDGKKIATGGLDGTIRIWDTETGEFVRALVGHNSYVYGLAWSPDGHTLASAGSFDGTARLWDAATGMTLRVLAKGHKGYTHHVAWSKDGKSLLVAGGTSGFLALWDVTKPEPVKVSETGNTITGIAWGPDPKFVAVSGVAIGVQVWDVREGKTPHVFQVPGQNGVSVSWSADGKLIAGSGATKTLVWEAESGKEKHTLDVNSSAIAFSPNSESFAVSTGTDVKVWTGFDKQPKAVSLADARVLAWSPDGLALFGTTGAAVKWAAVGAAKPSRDIDAAADGTVQYTPSRPFVTGIGSAAPQLWDAAGKLLGKLEGHTAGVTAVAWSKDGKTLATASGDKTVRLWDATGKPLRTLKGHEGTVLCVAWADAKTFASGSSDKTVRIWQATTDTSKSMRKHKGAVNAVAWSKDGKQLASGDQEHAVLIGLPESDKLQNIVAGAPVDSLAWAGNGKMLAVGLSTGNVEVYAPANGKSLQVYDRGGSPPQVSSLAWSPDSNMLLSGRGNHTAQVWPANGGKALFDLQCMAPVAHVEWSPQGRSMILSETDRCARVFDLVSGQLRSTVIADAKQVAIVSATGHYRLPDEAHSELVYVVQTAKGQETYTPKEFAAKFKFRNNPAAVIVSDK